MMHVFFLNSGDHEKEICEEYPLHPKQREVCDKFSDGSNSSAETTRSSSGEINQAKNVPEFSSTNGAFPTTESGNSVGIFICTL